MTIMMVVRIGFSVHLMLPNRMTSVRFALVSCTVFSVVVSIMVKKNMTPSSDSSTGWILAGWGGGGSGCRGRTTGRYGAGIGCRCGSCAGGWDWGCTW